MRYDRRRVMRDAHAEWRGTKHKPGMTFAKCLKLAWAVEKKRAKGREYYQPMEIEHAGMDRCRADNGASLARRKIAAKMESHARRDGACGI